MTREEARAEGQMVARRALAQWDAEREREATQDTAWTHEHFCPVCGSTWSHGANACQAPIRVPCPRSVVHPEWEQEVIRLEAIHRQRDRERYGY